MSSLVGYSPKGCKESDTTERLTLTLFPIPLNVWTTASLSAPLLMDIEVASMS